MNATEAVWAIQAMETAKSEGEGEQILAALHGQDGFLGGRVNPPAARGWWESAPTSPAIPMWTVQAFFEGNGEAPNGWLPNGMRHVLILASQRASLGIEG